MSNTSSIFKLGQCHVCQENVAKYKCPKCELGSCSLPCVQSHKIQSGCSGVRNRVALIPKHKMDNLTLLSDYRFLEEIDHKLEDCLRNPLRRSIQQERETLSELPFHLKKLKLEAKKRGTGLEFMPKHFSMHKENSTRFYFADKTIRWHIKWYFPQADLSFTDENVDENMVLINLLRKYMEPPYRLGEEDSDKSLTDEQYEKLSYYHSASYRRIAVLFKSTVCNYDKKFIKVFPSKSLKINLANKKVNEYPEFYVVLKDHLDAYLEEESEEEHMFAHRDKMMRMDNDPLSELNTDMNTKLNVKTPRVKKMDGGLSFFNADLYVSDSE